MKIFSAYKDGRLTLYLQGELDHHGVKNSMELIDKLIDEFMPRDCIIELSKLSFMDSSGIAVVINTLRMMTRSEGSLMITGLREQPKRVFIASGIDKLVEIKEAVS